MKLVISDDEVGLVKMALAREHHDRMVAFQHMQGQGHVKVVTNEQPAHITVQIEDEYLDDERGRFPTTHLMARLQLAIAAGRSCRNLRKEDQGDHAVDTMSYAMQARHVGKSALLGMGYSSEVHIGDMLYPAPLKKRVTAAVKKFAKGLRP